MGGSTGVSSVSVSSARISIGQLQIQICDAAAPMVLDHGVDAVTPAAVCTAASVTKARLSRVYKGRPRLLTGLYTEGSARIGAVCARHPRRGVSGVNALVALAYDLVAQAHADPVASVVHHLESTEYAADSALDSVYQVWSGQFTELVVSGGVLGPDPMLADTDSRAVDDVVNVLVSALAGLCNPRCPRTGIGQLFDHLHIVLVSVIPGLCTDAAQARHMREYLSRVHHYAVASVTV